MRTGAGARAARAVTVVGVALVAAAVLALTLLGWSAHVVVSGSMAPAVAAGDVVVTRPAAAGEDLVGRVVLIRRGGTPLLHRLVRGGAHEGFTSRGDANPLDDPAPVRAADVSGVLHLRVPRLGLPALWWHQGRYARDVALAALVVAGTSVVSRRPGTAGGGRRELRRYAPAGALAVVALGVGCATASAPPSTVNGGNSFTAAGVALAGAPAGALWTSAGTVAPQPGSTGQACVTVTYSGTTSAAVRLRPLPAADAGDAHVRLSITEGTAPAAADCTGFGGTTTGLYDGDDTDDTATLAAFEALTGPGLGTWNPSAPGQYRVYRVRWTVLGDDAAAGSTFSPGLRWVATST